MDRKLFKQLIEKHQGEIILTEDLYQGNFLGIKRSKVKLSNGKTIWREQITKNNDNSNVVYIFPVTKEGEVVLTMQSRIFTSSGVGIGVPAGYIDEGESSLVAAKRELREETGYTSNKFIKIAEFHQDSGCSGALATCYLALDCVKTHEQQLDGDEFIDLFPVSINDLEQLIEEGYVKSAATLILLNAYKNFRRNDHENRSVCRKFQSGS